MKPFYFFIPIVLLLFASIGSVSAYSGPEMIQGCWILEVNGNQISSVDYSHHDIIVSDQFFLEYTYPYVSVTYGNQSCTGVGMLHAFTLIDGAELIVTYNNTVLIDTFTHANTLDNQLKYQTPMYLDSIALNAVLGTSIGVMLMLVYNQYKIRRII